MDRRKGAAFRFRLAEASGGNSIVDVDESTSSFSCKEPQGMKKEQKASHQTGEKVASIKEEDYFPFPSVYSIVDR